MFNGNITIIEMSVMKPRTGIQLPKWREVSRPHWLVSFLQILRDRELQGGRYRRKQTQSSNSPCS